MFHLNGIKIREFKTNLVSRYAYLQNYSASMFWRSFSKEEVMWFQAKYEFGYPPLAWEVFLFSPF